MNKLKSAKEYLERYFPEHIGDIPKGAIELVKQIQKDTIDIVLKLAAENAVLKKDGMKWEERPTGSMFKTTNVGVDVFKVDKNSILNLKQQLLKEIE